MEMESTRWPVEAAVRNRALNRTALVNMNGEQLKTAMCGFWERTCGGKAMAVYKNWRSQNKPSAL